ncbi:MAG: hypothetical protein WAQ05_11015, partial [Rubrivivax sp.]
PAQADDGGPRRELALENPALAASEAARADLKYIAHCALDHRSVLVAEHAGREYRFPGQLGLAPRWHAQPMTPDEQRWVSACLLALQNHKGRQVQVSLLLSARPNAGVRGGWLDATHQYPLAEGRYFGNLFAPQPTAYVCSPAWNEAETQRWRERHRLCALPLPAGADGQARSVCEMVHVGPCSDTTLQQDGVHYTQSVQVFLPAD